MFFWINKNMNIILIGLAIIFSLVMFYLLVALLWWLSYCFFDFIFCKSKKEKTIKFWDWICEWLLKIWIKWLKDQILLTWLVCLVIVIVTLLWSSFDYYNAKSFIIILINGFGPSLLFFGGLSLLAFLIKINIWIVKKRKQLKQKKLISNY